MMSEYAPEDCHITTIEKYEKRIPIAQANFKRAGKEKEITLIPGDATEVLKTLEDPYDFLFMDVYWSFQIRVCRLSPSRHVRRTGFRAPFHSK